MTDEKNIALDDDLISQATGGGADADPYGYVCEGTVARNHMTPVDRKMYTVKGDNGRSYLASWNYRSVLSEGDRVQIIHGDDGCYELEPLRD